jgi:hypothetical protein
MPLPHQQRVIDEKSELDEKLSKLTTFTEGETFTTIPSDEQARLLRQLTIMEDYSGVLGERIAAFPAVDTDPPGPPTKP